MNQEFRNEWFTWDGPKEYQYGCELLNNVYEYMGRKFQIIEHDMVRPLYKLCEYTCSFQQYVDSFGG